MASVNKRRWEKPDGSKGEAWVVRWADAMGHHRQKTFQRKRDADGYCLKVSTEKAERGNIGYVDDRSVAYLASEYSRHVDQRLEDGQIKRGTHKNVMQALTVSILPHLGKMKVSELDPIVVERWFMAIRKDDKLSPMTALERLVKLAAMLDFAKRRKLAKGDNPAREAILNIGKLPKTKIRTLSPLQVATLLRTAEQRRRGQHRQTHALTLVAVHLSTFAGLRIGEILALRLCDIDVDGGRLHIRHTINAWDELTLPKTADSFRVVPIPAHVGALLKDWIAAFYVPNPRQLIFRSVVSRQGQPGGRIGDQRFNHLYWRPLVVAAGLEDEKDRLHFHALRHFAASWWLKNGLPITEASRLMGHSNPTITLSIYSHALMEETERSAALDTMSNALIASANVQEMRTGQKILQYQLR